MSRVQDKHTTEFMPFRDDALEPGTRIVATCWPATVVEAYTDYKGRGQYRVIYDDMPDRVVGGAYAHNIDDFIYDYPRPLPPTEYEIAEGR